MPDDLSGGTFALTNLGVYDVDGFTPVINLPEAAILGVGRIAEKGVVRDGEIVARHIWGLSLVFDHRLVDGAVFCSISRRYRRAVFVGGGGGKWLMRMYLGPIAGAGARRTR